MKSTSKSLSRFSFLPASAILVAAPLLADGVSQEQGQKGRSLEHRPPVFMKATVGAKAVVEDEAGKPLAHIEDYVVDPRSGQVRFIAVATDGNNGAHLVPYDQFSWNKAKRTLALHMSAEDIATLPAFDADELGGTAVGAAGGDQAGQARDASMDEGAKPLAASQIRGAKVVTETQPFAVVGDLLLEPNRGIVAFVLASDRDSGRDPYVIPWRAMKWQRPEPSDEPQGHFGLLLDAERLANAPKLPGGEPKALENVRALRDVYDFYGLSQPTADVKRVGPKED